MDCLDRLLTTQMIGVEFGSGRSTHWFAKRLKSLISIEHHQAWYETVQKQLQDQSLFNVDYRLIPLNHRESDPELERYETLPDYVKWLAESSDDSLDFVLVDGHYRTTCIRESLTKLKIGGLLLIDDVEMWYRTNGPPVPPSWECVDSSSNGLKTTKLWKRTV